MTLKLEPGMKRQAVERFSMRGAGRHRGPARRIALKLDSTRFGLKVGCEAMASTAPVRGSRATAAPHFPASCAIAARWARGLIVSQRLLPLIVAPRSCASVLSIIVLRFVFEPVR